MSENLTCCEPKVTVSIVSYNGLKTLPDCLASIFQQTYQNIAVVVVDNASTDGTPDLISKQYPQVELIHYPENKGPSPARNKGILHAETELVLLLDDDAFMEPDCLAQLVKASQDLPLGSVWVPRLVYSDRPQIIQHEGAHIHYISEAVLVNPDVPCEEGLKEPSIVSVVSGTCLLLKKEAALSIGLFDEDYFFGKTDGEFSFRLTLAGHLLYSIPQAVVRHRVKTRGLSKVFYQVRNRWYFTLTMFSWRTLILSAPALMVYELSLAMFLLSKGAFQEYLKGNIAVLRDLPKILEKRKKFQEKKVMKDKEILKNEQFNMRSDLLKNGLLASLKSLIDNFFTVYWKAISVLL